MYCIEVKRIFTNILIEGGCNICAIILIYTFFLDWLFYSFMLNIYYFTLVYRVIENKVQVLCTSLYNGEMGGKRHQNTQKRIKYRFF